MDSPAAASRYVKLTETGVARMQAARRRLGVSVEDIVADPLTPSINTVKRALRGGAVFVSTIERIWDFLQRQAGEKRERLPYLLEGEDFYYIEGTELSEVHEKAAESSVALLTAPLPGPAVAREEGLHGWISRHTPRPNRLFTGRADVLTRLHQALRVRDAALTDGRDDIGLSDPQAITGLGGIGKTQTALAYVYRHRAEYSRIFWLNAESVESLNDGLAAIADELELLPAGASSRIHALQRVNDWFRTESGWLVVLDNADDIEALATHFPPHHNGRQIITTRARNPVKWAEPVPLRRLTAEEGGLLLLRRAGLARLDQSLHDLDARLVQEARSLSEDLGGLPLALDQAGAYIAETEIAIGDYRDLFREQGIGILDRGAEPEHASVRVTFTLAMEQMAAHSRYGEEARDLVRVCAFLAPDDIPEFVLREAADGANTMHAAPFEEIIASVCRFSLASRHAANRTLTLHRLVQIVLIEAMTPDEAAGYRSRAVEAVSKASPDFEYEQWPICEQLLPQWRVCAQHIRAGGVTASAETAYLLYQAGRYLRARAQFAEAEIYLRDALDQALRIYGERHRITADYVDELACLCRVLDRYEEAEALHTRAIAILEQTEGPEGFLLTSKLHNMALLYTQAEQYERAEPFFLRALAIHEKQPEPDRFLTATAQTQLAGAYRVRGEYDAAERYCLRALRTYEEMVDPNHIFIATAVNNLALLYLTCGRLAEAQAHYERALAINRVARGEEHPETGTVLWGLARVYWKLGTRQDAETCFQRALHIYKSQLGADHSRTRKIAESYAEFRADGADGRLTTDG